MKQVLLLSLALIGASNATAVEVYESDKLSLAIGGNIQAIIFNHEGSDGASDTEVKDNGSRIHFDFRSPIAEHTEVQGFFEWYVNIVASDSIDSFNTGSNSVSMSSSRGDVFTNRQGFFGATNDHFGTFRIGKMYSVYQHVTGVTDVFNVYSAMASATYTYGDGGPTGTGRSDQTVQWFKNFDFGSGSLSLELQAQFSASEIDIVDETGTTIGVLEDEGSEGAAAIWSNENLSFGLSYVRDDSSGTINGNYVDNPDTFAGSFSYKNNDLYVAGVANTASQMYQDDLGRPFNGSGYEFAISYTMGQFEPKLGWNMIDADADQSTDYSLNFTILTLNYHVPSINLFTFIEGGIDNGTDADGTDSNRDYLSIGMYYPF